MALEAGLYVAATPIGNLADVTFRVVAALKECDLILCEDTRHTARLCNHYGILTKRSAYHDHNEDAVRPAILARLKDGAAICLVSDAGTPLISDPGFRLVRDARAAGIRVVPLPGPSALVAALSAAGAPTDRFTFAGFPPPKAGARGTFFDGLKAAPGTLVFYEAPTRLAASLEAMAEAFGPRRAVVARELTKLHEEFREGTLAALAAAYASDPPKGEIVVVVHPAEESAPASAEAAASLDTRLSGLLAEMSLKDAVDAAAEGSGIPRKEIYARALALKGRTP